MFNEIKKRAGREGGQVLVTENVNAQGASGLHALSSGTETTIIPEEEKANAEENVSAGSRKESTGGAVEAADAATREESGADAGDGRLRAGAFAVCGFLGFETGIRREDLS